MVREERGRMKSKLDGWLRVGEMLQDELSDSREATFGKVPSRGAHRVNGQPSALSLTWEVRWDKRKTAAGT